MKYSLRVRSFFSVSKRRSIILMFYTHLRFNLIVSHDRATRMIARNGWVLKKKQPRYPRPRMYSVRVFSLSSVCTWGVGREEPREDRLREQRERGATGRGRQLLALHVCRRIRGVIDGRAETETRALFGDMVGSPMFIFAYQLFSLALVASRSPRTRVRMYFAAPFALSGVWSSSSRRQRADLRRQIRGTVPAFERDRGFNLADRSIIVGIFVYHIEWWFVRDIRTDF